jgi:hypothetical protein
LLFRVMKTSATSNPAKLLSSIIFLLISLGASGQNGNLLKINSFNESRSDNITTLTDRQTNYIKNSYSGKIRAAKELINGKEYEPYYTRSKSKPLIKPDQERSASIITNTRRYNNLTLQYDTFLDEVIYTDTSRITRLRYPQIALNKNIIDGFNLYFSDDSLIFKSFRPPECSERNLTEGFYEVVYKGKSEYIIKHISTIYERDGVKNYKYSPKTYISLTGPFYNIRSRKGLLKLFGDKSGDIKKYLGKSHIRFRQANKNQITSVLKYYDSLVISQ